MQPHNVAPLQPATVLQHYCVAEEDFIEAVCLMSKRLEHLRPWFGVGDTREIDMFQQPQYAARGARRCLVRFCLRAAMTTRQA